MPDLPTSTRRLAYTMTEALNAVPIGRTKLFELVATGKLRSITIGTRRLIPADALDALMTTGAA